MRCRIPQFLFLVFVAGLVLMRESRVAPLSSFETGFASWLNSNTQRQPPSAPLTLVQITDDDLHSAPWPWSPMDYSLFLNAALPFHPPVLALEPVLDWQKVDPQQLAILHNQLLRTPKVLLGSELGFPNDPSIVPPLQEVPVLRHVSGDIAALREFTTVVAQPTDDVRLAGTLGFENLAADGMADKGRVSAIQRIPLVFRYRGQVVPSFVLQAAMLWLGVTPEEVVVAPGSSIRLGKSIRIPVDARGEMFVDFAIPITRFPMGDLLLSAEQSQAKQKTVVPVTGMKNSLTLLARTDEKSRTLRFSTGTPGSLGELFASAIATIQNHAFIRHIPVYGELLIIVGAMILAWLCARRSKLGSTVLCLAAFSAYMLVSLGTFPVMLLALPLVMPAGLIAFIALFRQMD